MTLRLDEALHGLRTEREFHINRMLRDYDPNLSLRRLPERDPAAIAGAQKTPPHTHGVWEENIGHGKAGAISNWVFTLAEMSIDERVFARVVEGDMKRRGVEDRIAKLHALGQAQDLSRKKAQIDLIESRREEMEGLGRLAEGKSTVRHTINGEDVIIGDTIRPVRRTV